MQGYGNNSYGGSKDGGDQNYSSSGAMPGGGGERARSSMRPDDFESSYGLTNIAKPDKIKQSPSQQDMSSLIHYPVQQRQQSSHTRQDGSQSGVLGGKHKSPLPFFAAQNVLGSSVASLRNTPFRQSYQESFSKNN